MEGTEFADLPMVPYDDADAVEPEADVDAAAASAIAAGDVELPIIEEAESEPVIGRSVLFDFGARRFVRDGIRPTEVRGLAALGQRVLLAVHTTRYAYKLLPKDFGMEGFDDLIGRLPEPGAVTEFEERFRDCIEAVAGVAALEDFEAHFESREGAFIIDGFTVVSEEGETLPLGPVTLEV